MQNSKTAKLVLCALFSAITAACAWISLPLPFTPVPVNLATLAVFLAGGLLGARYGSLSMVVYIFLGAVGAPVFSGFTSGVGVITGPTGGYLLGYITGAFIIGLLCHRKEKSSNQAISRPVTAWLFIGFACLLGLLSCYILGTLWFMVITGNPLWASLVMCVFPFLPGDALKILAATILIKKLRPHLDHLH